ncbi:hypothetical protein EJC51_46390 [Streptomyces aquilus]|uniref:Uncharacterized protein n=1 Tax=Streptomyces aquilus TaxID=2548456 RepID=A0A3S9IES0_9ACTN|nr:hypothetical protein [Streptomyces aquilus]AZP22822.1 hypothetical protein EJC51_46390 [Streptomyces aquilus]
MPKEPAHDPTYGYDPETKTVRVDQHDLARLLLMFCSLMREQKPGSWDHMRDYDLSFERLADAVDASSQVRYGQRWRARDVPDSRSPDRMAAARTLWPRRRLSPR